MSVNGDSPVNSSIWARGEINNGHRSNKSIVNNKERPDLLNKEARVTKGSLGALEESMGSPHGLIGRHRITSNSSTLPNIPGEPSTADVAANAKVLHPDTTPIESADVKADALMHEVTNPVNALLEKFDILEGYSKARGEKEFEVSVMGYTFSRSDKGGIIIEELLRSTKLEINKGSNAPQNIKGYLNAILIEFNELIGESTDSLESTEFSVDTSADLENAAIIDRLNKPLNGGIFSSPFSDEEEAAVPTQTIVSKSDSKNENKQDLKTDVQPDDSTATSTTNKKLDENSLVKESSQNLNKESVKVSVGTAETNQPSNTSRGIKRTGRFINPQSRENIAQSSSIKSQEGVKPQLTKEEASSQTAQTSTATNDALNQKPASEVKQNTDRGNDPFIAKQTKDRAKLLLNKSNVQHKYDSSVQTVINDINATEKLLEKKPELKNSKSFMDDLKNSKLLLIKAHRGYIRAKTETVEWERKNVVKYIKREKIDSANSSETRMKSIADSNINDTIFAQINLESWKQDPDLAKELARTSQAKENAAIKMKKALSSVTKVPAETKVPADISNPKIFENLKAYTTDSAKISAEVNLEKSKGELKTSKNTLIKEIDANLIEVNLTDAKKSVLETLKNKINNTEIDLITLRSHLTDDPSLKQIKNSLPAKLTDALTKFSQSITEVMGSEKKMNNVPRKWVNNNFEVFSAALIESIPNHDIKKQILTSTPQTKDVNNNGLKIEKDNVTFTDPAEPTTIKRNGKDVILQKVTSAKINDVFKTVSGYYEPESGRLYTSTEDARYHDHVVVSKNTNTPPIITLCDGSGHSERALDTAKSMAEVAQNTLSEKIASCKDVHSVLKCQLEALKTANDITRNKNKNGATTYIQTAVVGEYLTGAVIGDSKVYVFRPKDQGGWEAIDLLGNLKGTLDAQDAGGQISGGNSPIDLSDLHRVNVFSFKLKPNDVVYVCSDGIVDNFDPSANRIPPNKVDNEIKEIEWEKDNPVHIQASLQAAKNRLEAVVENCKTGEDILGAVADEVEKNTHDFKLHILTKSKEEQDKIPEDQAPIGKLDDAAAAVFVYAPKTKKG